MPILLADRMHCTYEEVLAAPLLIVQLYLELMAAEVDAEKDSRKKRKKRK